MGWTLEFVKGGEEIWGASDGEEETQIGQNLARSSSDVW